MTTSAGVVTAARRDPADAPVDDWRVGLPEPKRRQLRLWFWSIAAATFAMVVIGGITRLTQSGLSIVDWQPVIGVVPPLNEARWTEAFDRYRQFPQYRLMGHGMSLAEFKGIFFWEYLHRLIARLIGAVFLVPFVYFWRAGCLTRPLMLRALGLFGLGAMQGVMGWLMVKSGLIDRPSVSHYRLAAHLVLALVILGVSIWFARDLAIRAPRAAAGSSARRLILRWLTIVGALLGAQIVWGAFVAGLKAGLFSSTFPLMGGHLFPPGGLFLEPALLNAVQNPITVQWMHRLLGTVLLVSAGALLLRVRRTAPDEPTHRLTMALAWLIAAQYGLGVLTLIYLVPVSLAVVHQAMAVVIVAVWVASMHHVRNTDCLPAGHPERERRMAGLAPGTLRITGA